MGARVLSLNMCLLGKPTHQMKTAAPLPSLTSVALPLIYFVPADSWTCRVKSGRVGGPPSALKPWCETCTTMCVRLLGGGGVAFLWEEMFPCFKSINIPFCIFVYFKLLRGKKGRKKNDMILQFILRYSQTSQGWKNLGSSGAEWISVEQHKE